MAKILVVDDSRTVRNMLSQRLTSFGADVSLAVDGAEGLQQARNARYDLIITDLDMPRMNGFELCQEIRRAPLPGKPPVLIMGADFNDRCIEQGFKVGAWGYVPKYNLSNELLPRVRDVLEHKRFTALWRILVVDESENVRTLIQKELSAVGFQVLCAETGAKALETMQTHKPDLIICDLRLPDMDGHTLLESIKGNSALKRIPFMVLSHEDSHRTAVQMIENGASTYLMKPFNPGQLVTLTRRVMTNCHKDLEKENDVLTGEFEKMFGGIADLVKALEARDSFTTGHSQAVTDLSLKIGHSLGLPATKLKRLQLAARLHDLGKISLGDSILLKPGKLTNDEMRKVWAHPGMGAKLLRPFTQLKDIIPAVFQHHERYDGKGYPSGIKGKAINLFARIIAVADTFDSLTSPRPYRKAVSADQAMQTITEVSGTQLCPECVDAFTCLMRKSQVAASCLCDTGEDLTRLAGGRNKSSIKGKSIVVADGNRMFFKDVSMELKARGARSVAYARDGEQAWESINQHQADLLICDWDISGLNARQLMEKMAWSEDFCTTNTIITSHSVDNGQLAKIVNVRPSSILVKPFTLKDLATQVEGHFRQQNTPDAKTNDAETTHPTSLPEIISKTIEQASKIIQEHATCLTHQHRKRLHRFFSVNSIPLPAKNIDKTCTRFNQLVQASFVKQCDKQLSRISVTTLDDETAFRESMANFVNNAKTLLDSLSVEFYSRFQEQLMNCLTARADRFANKEAISWIVDEFRIDIVQKSGELHEALIGTLNCSLKCCQKLSSEKCKLVLHNLVDAFGRGLLEPLNDVYPIIEDLEGTLAASKNFPRQFCAPVLEVVRDFVIGREKYDKANRNILKSVHKFMGKDSGFEPSRLRDYFTHAKIRQYYIGSTLYCLKKLTSEVRRENFIRKINKRIGCEQPDAPPAFDDRAWAMLSRAWALSVHKNLAERQKTNKSVKAILGNYLGHGLPYPQTERTQ